MKSLPFKLPVRQGSTEIPLWTGTGFKIGDALFPVLEYSENFAGWSDDLTTLHEESAGDAHPIDQASRADAIRQLQLCLKGNPAPVILEIGCSSGFLLKEISLALPHAVLVGADVVNEPLYRLAEKLPNVPLMRFDLLKCPLPDATFDAVVLLNVLEHIEDDTEALRRITCLLKPGGVAIIEVPAGPHLYDAYDKALMHFRRYMMPDLVAKIETAGLAVTRKSHLGCLVYPAFAYVKRRNQTSQQGYADAVIVAKQAKDTASSFLMQTAMRIESFMGRLLSYPVGIRCLVTAQQNPISNTLAQMKNKNKLSSWPKTFPPLTPEQEWISDDFVKYWHEVLPAKYSFVDVFNHSYAVRSARNGFLKTLEVGCGIGEHIKYEKLTEMQKSNYVAVDIRENMINQLRKDFTWVNSIVGDCQERLSFNDSTFDRVIAIHVLEHLPNLPAAISEIYRLIDKEKGEFTVVIPCEGGLAYSLARKVSAQRIFQKRYKQSYKWFIEREHINYPFEIKRELNKYFITSNQNYFPVPLPLEFLNICIGLKLRPRLEPIQG